jgi:hypothetical protein
MTKHGGPQQHQQCAEDHDHESVREEPANQAVLLDFMGKKGDGGHHGGHH